MNTRQEKPQRLIVAMTGASGAIYGVRLLELLRETTSIETHLVISEAAEVTLKHEMGMARDAVEKCASVVHDVKNIGASLASGSFKTEGMIIAPCSMKTLSAVAHGYADNLIARAADVVLKERRKLVMLVRETPLNLIHIRNMATVTEAGGIIFPPVPSFYHQPQSLDEMVRQTVKRVLDIFHLSYDETGEWKGQGGIKNLT